MDESPCEGADVVEELNCGFGSGWADGTCIDEELEMGVYLFGRGVCDSVVMIPIPAGSTSTLCEIRGY